MDEFSCSGFLWRLVFSVALVLLTFNPTGHSYYHWLLDGFPSITPGEAVAGIVLLGAWIFFVRSTFAAMGALGVGLLLALFASIVWWVTSRGWSRGREQQATIGSVRECNQVRKGGSSGYVGSDECVGCLPSLHS